MKELNIKLDGKNAVERIEAEINEVQTRCRTRLIKVVHIHCAAAEIEKKLNIPKKYLDGIRARIDVFASPFAGTYKGIPESTQFEIENRKGHWYLIGVWRGEVKSPTNEFRLVLPTAAKEAIVNNYTHFATDY